MDKSQRPISPPDDPSWDKRIAKREAYLEMLLSNTGYDELPEPKPSLPDPKDRSISRRSWEEEMKKLRHAIKVAHAMVPQSVMIPPEYKSPRADYSCRPHVAWKRC